MERDVRRWDCAEKPLQCSDDGGISSSGCNVGHCVEVHERGHGTGWRSCLTRRPQMASEGSGVALTVEMNFMRERLYSFLGVKAWPLVPCEWWRGGVAICRKYVPHGMGHDAKEYMLVEERCETLKRLLARVRSAHYVRLNSAVARLKMNWLRVELLEKVCSLKLQHDLPSDIVNLVLGCREGYPVACRLWSAKRLSVWKQLRNDPPSWTQTLMLEGLVATRRPTGLSLYTLLTTDVWLQRRSFSICIDDVNIAEEKEPDPEIRHDLEMDLYIYARGLGDHLGVDEGTRLETPIEVVTMAREAYACRFVQILDNCELLRCDARGSRIHVEAEGECVGMSILAPDRTIVKQEVQKMNARRSSAGALPWCFLLAINSPSYQSWQLVVEP